MIAVTLMHGGHRLELPAGHEIANARVESVRLGPDDRASLTFWLHLKFGGYSQGFGGYELDSSNGFGVTLIKRIIEVIDASDWGGLAGMSLRAITDEKRNIVGVGHIVDDKWVHAPTLAKVYWP